MAVALAEGPDGRPPTTPREAGAAGSVGSVGAHGGHTGSVHADGKCGLVRARMRSDQPRRSEGVLTSRIGPQTRADRFDAMAAVNALRHEADPQ